MHTQPKTRIVVVEDDTILALDIQLRLHLLGFEVPFILCTGEQAIAEVEKDPPDLVLMDIMLGGSIEGTEAAAEIHRRFRVPIVFLTAYTDEKTLAKAKMAEPYGYITKPFDDTSIRIAIDIALHNAIMDAERREITARLAAAMNVIGRLSGILPVCTSCFSAINNHGAWQSLEEYLAENPKGKFNHCLCPDCTAALVENNTGIKA